MSTPSPSATTTSAAANVADTITLDPDQYASDVRMKEGLHQQQQQEQQQQQQQQQKPLQELHEQHHCSTIEDREREHFSTISMRDATIHNNEFLSCCIPGARRAMLEQILEDKKLAVITLQDKTGPCFRTLWKAADVRVCCDGSGEILWNESGVAQRDVEMHPHAVVGDVEAMRTAHLNALETMFGTKIVPCRDYQLTDLEKALTFLHEHQGDAALRGLRVSHVVVYGGLDGRLDKVLSRFHAIQSFARYFKRIVLLSDTGMAEVLMPGKHVIQCNAALEPIGTSCGLFPIGRPCQGVSTMGLQYNMDNTTLEFGCKVSAANTIVSERVKVICSEPLLWTVTFPPMPQSGSKTHA